MLRIIRYGFAAAAALVFALVVALVAAVLTLPQWLGPVLAGALPVGWSLDQIAVEREPLSVPTVRRLALSVGGCRLVALEGAHTTFGWRGPRPFLQAVEVDALAVDPACLRQGGLPQADPVAFPGWLGTLFDGAHLRVAELVVAGWLPEPHRLTLEVRVDALSGSLDGPVLQVAGEWAGDGAVAVRELQARQAQLATPALKALRPRLVLERPARLDPTTGRLSATLRLSADRLELTAGGELEQPTLTIHLDGTVQDLDWTAEGVAARGIGPARASGSWSGGVLTGRLTLARQALPPLQTLLPPTLPAELQAGDIGLDAVLTWSRDVPSERRLEGELRLSQGRVGLTHAVADGIEVRLPFGYAGGLLRLGGQRPGQIQVEHIVAAVEGHSASARIAGTWPWSARDPLRIDDLTLQLLGGEAALEGLRLPQRGRPAVLRLRGIQLDQVSALYEDAAVSLAGTIEADLPLHLDDAHLLVEEGVLRNATPLRLRLTDSPALESFKASNPALAQAADWLADLHVDRLDGTVNLQRDGTLLLVATIEGRNPAQGGRPVRLNYRHEENLLHLLESLRIGSDVSRGIEERVSPRSRSGP